MDAHHFDALTKALGQARTRRTALAGLAVGLIVPLQTVARKKRKHRSHGASRNQRRRDHHERRAQAEAVCYSGASCTPKPGANLTGCDFTNSAAMKSAKCAGCNLSKTGYRNADLSGADLARTNLDKACLVGANLRGALLTGANVSGAIYCGSTMPDGSISNRDCTRGTACCPTCDATRSCPVGQTCCSGTCVVGNCCNDAQCANPATPICTNNSCAPCRGNAQCGNGKVCCDGQCKTGVCCIASTCADRTCQNKSCPDNQCAYTPVGNGTACGQNSTCQNGDCVCKPVCANKACGASDGCGGTCLCPTVTVRWIPDGSGESGTCLASVEVTDFAPGTYDVRALGPNGSNSVEGSVFVEANGAGSTVIPVNGAFYAGSTYVVEVNGVQSAASVVAC